jgi:hypothetical protein
VLIYRLPNGVQASFIDGLICQAVQNGEALITSQGGIRLGLGLEQDAPEG